MEVGRFSGKSVANQPCFASKVAALRGQMSTVLDTLASTLQDGGKLIGGGGLGGSNNASVWSLCRISLILMHSLSWSYGDPYETFSK